MGLLRRRFAWIALLGAIAAVLALPWGLVNAAAPNQLSSPTVSPTSGETTTIFSFGVHYVGRYPATDVTVVVGPRTIVLALTSGSATDGTYAGSSQLPAGTWPVTFNAVATQANPPTINGPGVTVAGPTPSPKPSIAPAPTAAPTATTKTTVPSSTTTVSGGSGGSVSQAPATPAPVAAASGTPGPVVAALAGATDEAHRGGGVVTSPTLGGADFAPKAFWPVMLGGFGVIGLFVAYYVFAMDRDRRRRALAAEMALAAQRSAMAAPIAAEPDRAPAVWELDARLEDAPIGTVEYLPLENGAAIGSLPEDLSEPEGPRRGNPRQARMTDARKHRYAGDRRSLLRRS